MIVWDFEERKLLYRLKLHKVLIESLTFSHNDLYLSSLGGVEDKVLIEAEYYYRLGLVNWKIALRISPWLAQDGPYFIILQEQRRETHRSPHRRNLDNHGRQGQQKSTSLNRSKVWT